MSGLFLSISDLLDFSSCFALIWTPGDEMSGTAAPLWKENLGKDIKNRMDCQGAMMYVVLTVSIPLK